MYFLLSAIVLASLASASSVLQPPVLPLIVRSPYLSTWLPAARGAPWERWPYFYTGEEIGFSVLASVSQNSYVYPLLGRAHDSLGESANYNVSFPVYQGASYDASTTNLTYHIPSPHGYDHPAQIILSFLCPITPTSTLRQSLPACYITVIVEGNFDLSVYIDINGQWVSGDRNSIIEWEYYESGITPIKTWKIKKRDEALFTEWADRAEWGTLYFSGPVEADHQSGVSSHIRKSFSAAGSLRNTVDKGFRAIMDDEPIFAFSKYFGLGNSTSTAKASQSATFTIAHVQNPVVQYASSRGLTFMRPLWNSWYSTDASMINFHYGDFRDASDLARNYSSQLAVDAYKSDSDTYVDIVALSARQILGATVFSGTPENPLIFLKEISSNGNCQTVDVIFPAAPFFLYTNPRWLAYLLEPLLEHQLSGQYPNKYSMHDMGTHFPNQTGHADGFDEYMPVEECGNMLIMGLALVHSLKYESAQDSISLWAAQGHRHSFNQQDSSIFPLAVSGDSGAVQNLDDSWGGGARGKKQALAWLEKNYSLFEQWTSYLIEFSLEPHNQLSTDDFAGWLALQTNLALKGIVGIKAMSEIASIVGRTKDAKHYRDLADSYITRWTEYGISRDGSHAKLAYNWYGSWTTLYSLYADALLCFHPSITDKYSLTSETMAKPSSPPRFAHLPSAQRPLYAPNMDFLQGVLTTWPSKETEDFIPHHIYTNQSNYYAQVIQKYGLPLDSRHLYTKSDWEFNAAAVAEPKVRKLILDRVARWINETSTDRPLTDLYETEGNGGYPGIFFIARPVVGGHFAFLALERACRSSG